MATKTLRFRVTQRYADGKAEGKISLSGEEGERPYPVTREQAETCAKANNARFVEAQPETREGEQP